MVRNSAWLNFDFQVFKSLWLFSLSIEVKITNVSYLLINVKITGVRCLKLISHNPVSFFGATIQITSQLCFLECFGILCNAKRVNSVRVLEEGLFARFFFYIFPAAVGPSARDELHICVELVSDDVTGDPELCSLSLVSRLPVSLFIRLLFHL